MKTHLSLLAAFALPLAAQQPPTLLHTLNSASAVPQAGAQQRSTGAAQAALAAGLGEIVEQGEGTAVAVEGGLTVVGAPFNDTGATNSGVVNVYDTTTGARLHQILNPSPADFDQFGISVAISGMRVVVGAIWDATGAEAAGSAYVYDLGSATPTVPVATLNNPNPAFYDQFGRSVAISGTRVVVGVPYDDTGANDAGSAYVYDIASATPTVPVATLDNPSPAASDLFSFAVAISGTRVVVGAEEDDTDATDTGIAYVYNLSSGTPTVPEKTYHNPSPEVGERFGSSVAISGTRVVVGAERSNTTVFQGAGSAYVYNVGSGTTTPVVTLNNPSPEVHDSFGSSVAISGMLVVVGAYEDDAGALDAGSAYVYDLNRAARTMPVDTLSNPGPAGYDYFGNAVAISGTRVVVGALGDDTTAIDAGSAYVYDLTGSAPPLVVFSRSAEVPGEAAGTVFVEFGSPAIDDGEVGGAARIRSPGERPQTVIYGEDEGEVLVRVGGEAPGGAIFTLLGDPTFGGDGFALSAEARVPAAGGLPLLLDGRLGVADRLRGIAPGAGSRLVGLFSRLSRTGQVRQVARQGGAAAGTSGALFAKLPSFGLPRERAGLIYTGRLKAGGGVTAKNDFGVWREKSDAPGESDLLLRTGGTVGAGKVVEDLDLMEPVTRANDQRRSFAPDGGVVAAAKFDDGTTGVVRASANGTVDVAVDSGTDAPDLPGARFERVGAPASGNGGLAAFHATLRSVAAGVPAPREAVFASQGGTFRAVSRHGDALPGGTGERFSRFDPPVMSQGGVVAFIAALQGQGVTERNEKVLVRVEVNGSKRVVARLGDQAPGFPDGAVYQRIQSIVQTDNDRAHLAFTGTAGGGGVAKLERQAIWSVATGEEVKLVLRANQPVVVGGEVLSVWVFEALKAKRAIRGQGRTADDAGFLVARVTLTDGRRGILRIPLP